MASQTPVFTTWVKQKKVVQTTLHQSLHYRLKKRYSLHFVWNSLIKPWIFTAKSNQIVESTLGYQSNNLYSTHLGQWFQS